MRRRAPILALAQAIALASPTVSAARLEDASAAASSGPSVRLVVDSKLSEFERDELEPWIHEDGTKTLTRAGARVMPDGDTDLEVRIVVRYEDMNYYFRVSAWEPGAARAKVERDELECKVCNHTELLTMINSELMWLGGWMVHPPGSTASDDGETSDDEGTDGGSDSGTDDSAGHDDDGESHRPHGNTLRNAGIGLLVPGGVALGVGIGLAIVNTRPVDSSDERTVAERHYRPAGIALAVTGGAVAVTGAVLLALHARRAKRADAVSLSPLVGPSTTGIAIGGRF